MPKFVEQQIIDSWPPAAWQDVVVVVAVSGGADSVALLRALARLAPDPGTNLVLGHFNHRLRPCSAQDERFAQELGNRLQLRCQIGRTETDLLEACAGSVEEAARDARYQFLSSVARHYGARYIATAHTADDQIETIVHRILRGTGIAGLAGIPRTRELVPGATIVRPLLTCHRHDILNYLHELGQSYVEDETNRQNRFSRNRIRNELLPQLAEVYNPRIGEAILRLGRLAAETSGYLDSVADEWIGEHIRHDRDSVELDGAKLQTLPPLMIRTVLMRIWRRMGWPEQNMSFAKWEELADQLQGTPNSDRVLVLPGSIRAEKKGDKQVLVRPR